MDEKKKMKFSPESHHARALSIKIIRAAMVGISVIVFLGYIMMWCIMPTDTYYNKWVPHIMADTNSTYFGLQGPIILDFTFPILFLAVVGCIYTHLGKVLDNGDDQYSNKAKKMDSLIMKVLKKPLILKGLGIVTWIELFFFAMFILLTLWYFSAYMHFWYEKINMVAMSRGDQV